MFLSRCVLLNEHTEPLKSHFIDSKCSFRCKKVIYEGKMVIFNEKWWFFGNNDFMNFWLTYDQRSSSSCFAFATFSFNFFFISSSRSRSNDGSKSNCINGSFFAFSFQINLDITHIPFFYKKRVYRKFHQNLFLVINISWMNKPMGYSQTSQIYGNHTDIAHPSSHIWVYRYTLYRLEPYRT